MPTPQKETPTSGGNHLAGVNTQNTSAIIPEFVVLNNARMPLSTEGDGAVLAVNLFEELSVPMRPPAKALFIQSALMVIAKSTNVEEVWRPVCCERLRNYTAK